MTDLTKEIDEKLFYCPNCNAKMEYCTRGAEVSMNLGHEYLECKNCTCVIADYDCNTTLSDDVVEKVAEAIWVKDVNTKDVNAWSDDVGSRVKDIYRNLSKAAIQAYQKATGGE